MNTKILTPSRSQRNHSSGIFSANSLGSVPKSGKKVNMIKVKAMIRRSKRVRSDEFQRRVREEARLKRQKKWWKYRQFWKSIKIGNSVGKLNPNVRGRVEFSDGHIQFIL